MADKTPHTITAPPVTVMKSKFTGVFYSVNSETAARESVKALKAAERKARHIVFAFRIADDPVAEGMSDDGEPRGTGGLPILQILRHENLTNILIAVVRHYGGIKLGPGNLRRAYATAAKAAIERLPDLPITFK
jgi:putative IMPACT (imprinted ancient) family translation regulator